MIYPSWPGIEVASLVVVGGLITFTAILFFSNVSRQKQNVFPLLIFIIIAIIGLVSWPLYYAVKNHLAGRWLFLSVSHLLYF